MTDLGSARSGPTVRVLGERGVRPAADPPLRDGLLALWAAVTDAGGSVGFAAPADRAAIGATLDRELTDVESGRDDLLVLVDGDDPIGMVFLRSRGNPLFAHWRTVMRLMVHPDRQGHGHARTLLDAAHHLAREQGCDHVQLTVRGGEGLEPFYEHLGYQVVGAHPRAVRLPDGTDRDEVMLVADLRDAILGR